MQEQNGHSKGAIKILTVKNVLLAFAIGWLCGWLLHTPNHFQALLNSDGMIVVLNTQNGDVWANYYSAVRKSGTWYAPETEPYIWTPPLSTDQSTN